MPNLDLCRLKTRFAAFRAKQNLKALINDSEDYLKHEPVKCMVMAVAAGFILHKLFSRK